MLLDSLVFLNAYPWGRVVGRGKDRLVISDMVLTIHDVALLIPPFELSFSGRGKSAAYLASRCFGTFQEYAVQHRQHE